MSLFTTTIIVYYEKILDTLKSLEEIYKQNAEL